MTGHRWDGATSFRSLWRPLVSPWILTAVLALFFLFAGQSLPAGAFLAMGTAVSLAALAVLLLSRRPVGAFLEGMREAGASPVVERRSYGWLGSCTAYLSGPAGRWRIFGHFHLKGIELRVLPPGGVRSLEVFGSPRRAGREMAERALRGLPAGSGVSDEEIGPLAPGGQSGVPPRAAAGLLAATGCGLIGVAAALGVAGAWSGAWRTELLVPAGAGAASIALAVWAWKVGGGSAKAGTTAGAVVALLGALHLSVRGGWPLAGGFGVLLALTVLYFTWGGEELR